MTYRTTTEARELLTTISGLSDQTKRDWTWLVTKAERADEQSGRRMLSDTQDSLESELRELADEAAEIKGGFTILGEIASRPDVDSAELATVHEDLISRARFLGVRADGWQGRAEEHNEQISDPSGAWEAFTKKWAERSGHPDQYLHSFPW